MCDIVHTSPPLDRKLDSRAVGEMSGVAAILYEFLTTNRPELIARCRAKAAKRLPPSARPLVSDYGIPQFLAQLIETFRIEQTPEALARHQALGPRRPSLALVPSDIASTAAKHGGELRRQGITIDQVVHGYGDLCQAMTELAMERDAPISVDEFHTFNRCLDDAIADAVTAYSRDVDPQDSKPDVATSDVPATSAPAGTLGEMRNLVHSALLSFAALKTGEVGVRGITAALHERSLVGLRDLLDRASGDNVETPAAKTGPSP